MVGKTIQHYKILEKLGGGGMGVVYKATDTKLKREVALKFLPPTLTNDAETRQRFIQEAQAASALDQNNICTIHEIGETEDGEIFIAMSYYPGETLKQKIERRPLPIGEAIDIATQISYGLAKAHESGIVHRDIKPANILLTESGEVKILDFGLAKLTGQTKLTKLGTTIGTAAYMSPEQMRGDKVDHRSDIWSLGVVLYEMLTGQLPFKGDYEQAISYAILNEEPEPITALRTGIPMALEWIVNKAIAKDPKKRYQHVDEFPVDLENIENQTSSVSVSKVAATKDVIEKTSGHKHRATFLLSLGVLMGITIGIGLYKVLFNNTAKDVIRAEMTPLSHQFREWVGLAISPDGKRIVYKGSSDYKGPQQLYIRDLDEPEGRAIAGTEGGREPFFSSDGRWIGFRVGGRIMKVAADGGIPQSVSDEDVAYGFGGTCWTTEERILFIHNRTKELMGISANTGEMAVVAKVDSQFSSPEPYRWPAPLPGGKAVLCNIWSGNLQNSQIGVVDLDTGNVTPLIEDGTYARYTNSGHIVYVRTDGTFMAAPFDPVNLEITAPPVAMAEKVHVGFLGYAGFALSGNGTLVYYPPSPPRRSLVEVTRKGIPTPVTDEQQSYHSVRYSPDGTKLALETTKGGKFDIWVYDLKGAVFTPLTFEGSNVTPQWTPDGERVTFSSNMAEVNDDLYQSPPDGSSPPELLHKFTEVESPFLGPWSPDGQHLLYHTTEARDIWILPVTEEPEPRPWLATDFNEYEPAISPDGRWVVYVSDETGEDEVYVRSFLEPGKGKWPISSGGGRDPVWSPDGSEVFYRWGDTMFAVAVQLDPVFTPGERKILFEGDYTYSWNRRSYDVHPDGEHFAMIAPGEVQPSRMFIVLNWSEELKRKIPSND